MFSPSWNRLFHCLLACLLWPGAATVYAEDSVATTRFTPVSSMPPVLESDAQKNDPETAIVAPIDYYREGDQFLIKSTAAISGEEAWAKVVHEWVEPITAPDGTAPKVASDEMILVELQGKVFVQTPGSTDAVAATEGQVVSGGSKVITGDDGTAAIFIGGINSLRLGPETRLSLTYQVVGPFRVPGANTMQQRRTTRVQLEEGKVFCKIGYEPQVEQYFQLDAGLAGVVASAGDMVVLRGKTTLDIGVARGAVRIIDSNGQEMTTITVTTRTGLQILHLPGIKGQLPMMTANSMFLQTTIDLIEKVNRKVAALRQRHGDGQDLTVQEREYIDRLPTMIFLQRVRKLQ